MIESYCINCWILSVFIVPITMVIRAKRDKLTLTLDDYLAGLGLVAFSPIIMPAIFFNDLAYD